ncbi:hypothetical protein BGZ95_004390 [Linnemannia exigua]|uniref:Galactose oxidase n=1 Tax=Linnemannia exigua TaxID=604196 RepID=A0AAD4H1Q8_9FUNG|nr:hypothetical protein BGZ95_004390 [Linnemannia exigua]
MQGGLSATGTTRTKVNQFMGLDLTLSTWSTSNPPWKYFLNTKYPDNVNRPYTPPPNSSHHSMTTARDQDNLFVWDPTQEYPWYTYDLKSSYWNRFQIPNITVTQTPGARNGVDLDASLLDAYAYGGSKMIVFGGHGLDGVAKADIYFFEPSTRQWTTGKATDPAQARTNMACVVAGDSFIAWGGENGQNIMDGIPIVYDLKNNQWTTQFNRIATATTTSGAIPSATSNSATSPSSESETNAAAIGGAGAVVVITLVGFLLYRRRNSRQNSNINSSDSNESRNRFTTGTNNKNDNDAAGLSARDPQDTDGDYKRASYLSSGIPSPVPPMLMPRQTDDRDALYGRFVTHFSKTPPTGPHSAMRDPQGNDQPRQMQYFSSATNENKAEWSDDSSSNITHPSPPPIPARPSHIRDLKNNTTAEELLTYSIDESDSRSVQPYAMSPPQSPTSPWFPRSGLNPEPKSGPVPVSGSESVCQQRPGACEDDGEYSGRKGGAGEESTGS